MTQLKKLTDRFVEADMDGKVVIMRLDDGEYYSLAGTGVTIWRLIDAKRDKTQLLTAAASEFDVTEDEIASDIDEILTQLKETGLLAEN